MGALLFPDGAYHSIRHGLYDPTMAFDGGDWARDVLEPWVAANQPIVAALHDAGRPAMASVVLEAEDRWALYAFSHVIDQLILPLQPPSIDPEYPADWLPPQVYRQFIEAIGGTVPSVSGFHPFHHEIVAVGPASGEWWPGCMVGSLLLSRAGVTVSAGVPHLDPVVATTSCMYWASRRRHRPAADLSHGWGNNSRWRTSFRRDYLLPDRYAYNVDAALRPARRPAEDLPADATDLVRHRCSTTTDHGDEVWIWDTPYDEPRR